MIRMLIKTTMGTLLTLAKMNKSDNIRYWRMWNKVNAFTTHSMQINPNETTAQMQSGYVCSCA